VACGPTPSPTKELLQGDAARGAQLFTQAINGAPACSTCHSITGATQVGPGFQGFANTAALRVPKMSAHDYAYTSITQPASYIVSGFTNSMFAQYAQRLNPQEIKDLIAYLLTL